MFEHFQTKMLQSLCLKNILENPWPTSISPENVYYNGVYYGTATCSFKWLKLGGGTATMEENQLCGIRIWTPGFDSPIFYEVKAGFRLKKFGKLILPPQFYETRYVFFFSTHKPYFTTIYTNSIDYNFTSNWPRTMILYAKTTF